MARPLLFLLSVTLVHTITSGCDRQPHNPESTPSDVADELAHGMWAHQFLGTIDIQFSDGRNGRTGFTLIDKNTIAMSGSWLFDAIETEVSLLCCDPSTVVGVVGYDAARNIVLARIDPPLSAPSIIPAKPMPAEDEHPYRIVYTLPISFEVGPGFSEMPTTVEQRVDWAGIGEVLIFASEKKLVMSGSLVVNDEGYPIAILNAWGGGSRDIGTELTDVLAMPRHDLIPLARFGPEHMTGQQQADALVIQALDLRDGGQLQRAYEDASHCLKIDPNNWRALYELGVLADMMGNDLGVAEDYLLRSTEIEDAWSEGRYSLGLVQYKRGRYEEAIESLSTATMLDDANPDAHHMLGLAHWQRSGPEHGLPWLQIACVRAPDTFMYYDNLWSCLSELDREAEALEPFQSFVERNPTDAEGRAGLAQLCLQLRKPGHALPHYQWLVDRSPDDPDLLMRLAFCQIQVSDRQSAESTLDRLESIAPDHELIPRLRQQLEN
ncbi:MAG: tetratricopeptide repeat protein [Phycisphaerales bacterium JB047]